MENLATTLGMGDKRESDITIDMLDYKYIDECKNAKILEKILRALRSGRDGYFPHLVKHCEEKLGHLNPKSRYLRTESKVLKSRDLTKEDAESLESGMGEWINNMKISENAANGFSEKELPPVRSNHKLAGNGATANHVKKSERIRGSDFKAWDKYDADEECKKVDNSEYVSTKKKDINIPHSVDVKEMSEVEKQISSDKEKEKGNEAFKAGDFEEALAYYSRSVSLSRTAASINNRALTYLRLEKWNEAEQDCSEVLKLEKDNIKAKLRRATALKELAKYEKAKADLEDVLKTESNNVRARKILDEVNSKMAKKGRKMKIMEVEEDGECPAVSNVESPITNGDHSSLQSNQNKPSEAIPAARREKELSENESTKNEKKVAESINQAETKASSHSTVDTTESIEKPVQGLKIEDNHKSELVAKEQPSKEPDPVVVQSPLPPHLETIKIEAGNLFRAGQYGEASEKYSLVITRLQAFASRKTDGDFSHSLAVLYNNRAACKLKSGDDKSCISDCSLALELKPRDVKAYMRRAAAYEHMEKYKLAYADYRAAQNIDWTASLAQVGANRVAKHLRDLYGSNWKSENSDRPIGDVSTTKPASATSSKLSQKMSSTSAQSNNYKRSPRPASTQSQQNKSSNLADASKKSQKQSSDGQKRAQFAGELYSKLKEEGNKLVKKGNFAAAIDKYTHCIKVCPEEVASYTNRALCFLKLKKDLSAAADCSEALKLDPRNVKAYFRRAQANKNLKLYGEAEKDLRKILEIEPTNKPASVEIKEIQKLALSSKKRKIPIKEVSDDESGSSETENNEVESERPDNSKSSLENKIPTVTTNLNNLQPKQHSNKSKSTKPTSLVNPLQNKNEKSSTKSSDLHIPEKLTPYEFGNLWNSVHPKTNLDAYKCILDNVRVDSIPKMVSNKITDHMVAMFAEISRRHLASGDIDQVKRAYQILNELTKAQRFEMAVMFLSKGDKASVVSAVDELAGYARSNAAIFTLADLERLRKAYML